MYALLGAVIMGSVDGNRIWGKEMKNLQLSKVEVVYLNLHKFGICEKNTSINIFRSCVTFTRCCCI